MNKEQLEAKAEAFADSIERRGCSLWSGLYKGYMYGHTAALSGIVEQCYSESEVVELLRQQREKCARAYLDNFKNHGILNAPEPQLKSSLK
jgi:hypothetical protein